MLYILISHFPLPLFVLKIYFESSNSWRSWENIGSFLKFSKNALRFLNLSYYVITLSNREVTYVWLAIIKPETLCDDSI